MAYQTASAPVVDDLLLEGQTALLHHPPGRGVICPGHADDPLQADDLEAVLDRDAGVTLPERSGCRLSL